MVTIKLPTGMTMARKLPANLSSDLVKHLRAKGKTLQQIADMVGLSKSVVSRVAKKEKSFTIEHLLRIEQAMKRPLPLLLLETMSKDSIPEELAPLYDAARDVLKSASQLGSVSDAPGQQASEQAGRRQRQSHRRAVVNG